VVRGPKKRKKVKIAFKAPSNHCCHTQTPHRSCHSSHGTLLFWRLVPVAPGFGVSAQRV
jgi:hypothetical protein